MTEINFVALTKNKRGVGRTSKKISKTLRIDMTPMVDLGFLLITFFIFSTELSKPATTNLNMAHDGPPVKIAASKSLTILVSGSNKIFYYYGTEFTAKINKQIYLTTYNESTGLGRVIREKQLELEKRQINKNELVILIKPGNKTFFRDFMDVLDEMLINDVTRYAVVSQEKDEIAYISRYE